MLTTEGMTFSTTGAKPSCQLMAWAWAAPVRSVTKNRESRVRRGICTTPWYTGLWRIWMSRMVKCVKLGREGEGIAYKPFDNELGQKIYDNVSQEAWRLWLEHSKM